MHAVVSLLDPDHYALLEQYWRELEYECGLTGIYFTPIPHFSYHIGAEYDFKRLEPVLADLALEAEPFTVRTSGLGIFSGAVPVLYVPIIKSMELAQFHKKVWERVHPISIGASPHYSPEVWTPHITMAYGDVDRDKLACAVQRLAFQSFDWTIAVDHLALVYQYTGEVGKIQNKLPFPRTQGEDHRP